MPDPQALQAWINAHAGATTHCVALIDPSRYRNIDDCVRATGMEAAQFTALPNLYAKYAKSIRELGPRLLDLPDGVVPMPLLKQMLDKQAASILVLSDESGGLDVHLMSLIRMPQPDGGNLLFRFQDVVVLTALAPLLSPLQRQALLGPASKWLAVDFCHHPVVIDRGDHTMQHPSPPLRLDQHQIDALGEALRPLGIIHQANETDTTLLAGMTKCAQVGLIRDRVSRARARGLSRDEDLSLYCLLSLQLPAGFDSRGPVAEALQDAQARGIGFGEAIDEIPVERWREWDEVLDREGYR